MIWPDDARPAVHHLQANGMFHRCLEWKGPPAGGPAVLLLHGLTSCAETWAFVAPALARGARVLALDLRGHGDTDKPGHGYDFPTIRADIEGVMDRLDVGTATLAGHSWGASIAAMVAGQLPDRVDRLALVDGGFIGPARPAPMSEEELERMLAPAHIYASVGTYLGEVRRHFPGAWTAQIEAIALASIYRNDDGTVREKLDRGHQKLILQGMFGQARETEYAAIRCPALMIAAESSDPAAAERMAAKRTRVDRTQQVVPQVAVRWVPDTVHDIQLHRPEVLLEELTAFVSAPAGAIQ
ncbi:MAG: alpha/beta hydrolase [Chloroflexota bacterium]